VAGLKIVLKGRLGRAVVCHNVTLWPTVSKLSLSNKLVVFLLTLIDAVLGLLRQGA
jgi:hypothetical protein